MKYVPDEKESKRLFGTFRDWARQYFELAVADASLREEFRKSLTGKWGLINNRSLRGRMTTMAKELKLRFDTADVKEFVDLRNDAVHAISLEAQDPYEQFRALRPMEDLLVRIMLRLIGYQGEYRGYRNGFETLFEVE